MTVICQYHDWSERSYVCHDNPQHIVSCIRVFPSARNGNLKTSTRVVYLAMKSLCNLELDYRVAVPQAIIFIIGGTVNLQCKRFVTESSPMKVIFIGL